MQLASDIVAAPYTSVVVIAGSMRFVLYNPKLGWSRSPDVNTVNLEWLSFTDDRFMKTGLLTWKEKGARLPKTHKILYAETREAEALIRIANAFATQ